MPGAGTGATVVVGLAIAALLLVIYVVSNPSRTSYYNHFVWQAEAFLDGRAAIRYPVYDGPDGRGNNLFQDVVLTTGPNGETTGYALLPFPPLPAVVLMPFVAVWGLATDAQLVAALLGAVDVAIAFWVLGRLPIGPRVRIATTLFLGLGTVLWYAAELGTTWYLAHVVAMGLTLLAIGVALSNDPVAAAGLADPVREPAAPASDGHAPDAPASHPLRWRFGLDRSQVLAGILFGLACTARLTVVFGLPFFLLVGGGGDRRRRGISALVGMAIPIGLLVGYTYVTTGHLLAPGLRVPLPDRGHLLPGARLSPRLGHRGSALPRPEPPAADRRAARHVLPASALRAPSDGLFDPACPVAVAAGCRDGSVPDESGLAARVRRRCAGSGATAW